MAVRQAMWLYKSHEESDLENHFLCHEEASPSTPSDKSPEKARLRIALQSQPNGRWDLHVDFNRVKKKRRERQT